MTGREDHTAVLPWPLRPPRRVGGVPVGLLVCWQVALVPALVAIGRPIGHVAVLGVLSATVVTVSGLRPRGRWTHEWLLFGLRYLARQYRRPPTPQSTPELATPELALLASAAQVAAVTDVDMEGQKVAVMSHPYGCAAVMELDVQPAPDTVLLPLRLAPASDPDAPQTTVQLLVHTVGGHPPRCWLVVQVRRRAGYPTDQLHAALTAAVRRVWRRLRREGLAGQPLDTARLVPALRTLTRLDLAGPAGSGVERWRTWWTGPVAQESLAVRAWSGLPDPPDRAVREALLRLPSPHTVSVAARRLRLATAFGALQAGDEALAIEMVVRVTERDRPMLDAATRWLRERLTAAGARVERLDGRQLPGLAATLPVGGFQPGYPPAATAFAPPPKRDPRRTASPAYPAAVPPPAPALPPADAPAPPAPAPPTMVAAAPPAPAPAAPPVPATPATTAGSVAAPPPAPIHDRPPAPEPQPVPAAGAAVPLLAAGAALPLPAAGAALPLPAAQAAVPLPAAQAAANANGPAPEPVPATALPPATGRAPALSLPPAPPVPAAAPPTAGPPGPPAPVSPDPAAVPAAPLPGPPPQPFAVSPPTGPVPPPPLAPPEPLPSPAAPLPAFEASLFIAESAHRSTVERLIEIVRTPEPGARLIAVAAAVPGVGTSMTATGIARTLAMLRDEQVMLRGATTNPEVMNRQTGSDRPALTVVDVGADTGAAVIAASDRLVVVTGADQPASAATREVLARVHRVHPARAGDAVIAAVCRNGREFRRMSLALSRDQSPQATRIVPVPHDPDLSRMDYLDLGQIRQPTREAYLRLAAALTLPVTAEQPPGRPPGR